MKYEHHDSPERSALLRGRLIPVNGGPDMSREAILAAAERVDRRGTAAGETAFHYSVLHELGLRPSEHSPHLWGIGTIGNRHVAAVLSEYRDARRARRALEADADGR